MPDSTSAPRAVIADDERLLRDQLRARLAEVWPELEIVGEAKNGIEAVQLTEQLHPDLVFLDIRMPGMSGVEAARAIAQLPVAEQPGGESDDDAAGGWAGCEIVFITAYDQYAVQAFEQGAVDYLLKPIETARLAQALGRVRERLARPPADLSALLEQLQRGNPNERLQWITVLQGRDIQFIAVDDVCYFRADNKYIAVVTATGESLITTPLKELVARLDPGVFWQVHRGVVVNMHAVQSVRRSITGQLDLKLKARPEMLRVSAGYSHLFKHM